MTRYFIGLMVPPSIQQRLTHFSQTVEAALPGDHACNLSWTAPIDLHCTLLYLGPNENESHLEDAMRRIAAQLTPASLTIRGATHWLGRNSLSLPVSGAEEAGACFVEHLGHLSSDVQTGTRPFYGHVTLGRVRPRPDTAHDPFVGHRLAPLAWKASSVHLVKSRASITDKKRYQIVAHAPFGG